MSQALYRKWRSQSFSELVGQEPVTRTLKNAVASGRTSHAYLFCGPRGTGKTSSGRILAKALNCLNPHEGEPCNECRICQAITEGRLIDLIEIDAASNRGIDEIRDLRDKIRFSPTEAKYKVYIVDEVHMLTDQAFNALLKTLEEPPPHAVFILATTEAHKLPATIVSRCQRFDFRRIRSDAAIGRLREICAAEGIATDDAALSLIAKNASGSLRDAENLLDQLVSFYGNVFGIDEVRELLGLAGDERSRAVVEAALGGNVGAGLATIHAVVADGADLRQFNREVVETLRRVMLLQNGAGNLLDLSDEERHGLERLAALAGQEKVVEATRVFSSVDLRNDALASLPIELALFDAIHGPKPVVVQEAPAARSHAHASPRAVPPVRPAEAVQPAAITRPEPVPVSRPEPALAAVAEPDDPYPAELAPDLPAVTVYKPQGDLDQRWRELRAAVRAADNGIAGLLTNCRPVTIEADHIVIVAKDQFLFRQIQKQQARLEKALSTLTGETVRFECQIRQPGQSADAPDLFAATSAPRAADDREELLRHPVVQHMIQKHSAIISLDGDNGGNR